MSVPSSPGQAVEETGSGNRLVLEIWHPECWTLETTAGSEAGLVAHGVYEIDGTVNARVTVYGDTREEVESLIERIEDSKRTERVERLSNPFESRGPKDTAGNTTEQLVVQYSEQDSIHRSLVDRGFVPVESIRIHNGREYWTVIANMDRQAVRDELDHIEREMGADIEIKSLGQKHLKDWESLLVEDLSERQREVMELARERGYYEWPRETNASELADELGVSKTTFLEHLRKAESKVIGRQ